MTPDARLLITPECPHCPVVAEILMKLVKEGLIGRLEIINLAVRPEVAAETGARSVPWFRIGEFVYTGAHGETEIRQWAEQAAKDDDGGWASYYHDLIDQRELDEAIASLRKHPGRLCELIQSLEDTSVPMVVKIGIGAVIEEFQGEPALLNCLAQLESLSQSSDPATRADAGHYLGLTASELAIPMVEKLLNDDDPHVREIAEEALADLKE